MQCLETPNGLILAGAGNAALVPEGWPISISSVGPHTRRALVLVLHRIERALRDAGRLGTDAPWRSVCALATKAVP